MKRALFCVWMVLALGWCTAWAETDWPPMTAVLSSLSFVSLDQPLRTPGCISSAKTTPSAGGGAAEATGAGWQAR